MTRGGTARRDWLLDLPCGERRALLEAMTHRQRCSLGRHWLLWAHIGQLPPPGDWFGWMVMAGRRRVPPASESARSLKWSKRNGQNGHDRPADGRGEGGRL